MSRFVNRLVLVCLIVFSACGNLKAQNSTPPELPAVRKVMEQFVQDREIAGAVTLVADPEKVVHFGTTGQADIASNRSMTPDTIFWIASMTKPITATAVMMLQDEGKLSIEDPVSKYIPEFEKLRTKDGKPVKVTLRHLLTHTSGMGDISSDEAKSCKTLAEAIPLFVEKPVQFEPGTKWQYCQSSINTAGRIVEIVSGELLPDFLAHRVFEPLGMKDTTFYLTEEQLPRLATSYSRNAAKELEPAENRILYGKSPTSRDRFPAANGGLFSTAPDYLRFCRMILAQGEAGGRRILKPESVRLMTTIQTDDLKTGFTPGNGWGIGWCVVREPQGVTAMMGAGTHGHGGAYGTQAWIDPKAKRIYILMVQRANFANSDDSPVRRGFQATVAEALGTSSSANSSPAAKAKAARPAPRPTLANVPYGDHPRQVLDFYQAESKDPTPLVVFIHGGGWVNGDKSGVGSANVDRLRKEGISVAAINYRFTTQADEAGIRPPVKWPLEDAARAIQFLRSKSGEWNIDKTRIGATGGSAGACSSLWLAFHDDMAQPESKDPVARESTRLTCAAVIGAQTSLDPKQLRVWMPNMKYGGHAFGFRKPAPQGRDSEFQRFYDHREEVLPWIKEYSPFEHAGAGDPPIFLDYPAQNKPAVVGEEQRDPTHSAVMGLTLQEKLRASGVEARLSYPDHKDDQYANPTEFLIAKLKPSSSGG